MLHKIADTLYEKEFKYLDYLNHMVTECEQTTTIEGGCPMPKCKCKQPMEFNELRNHLLYECNKVMLECSQCNARFRRPWKKYHDCRSVHIERLQQAEERMDKQDAIIAEKTMTIADLTAKNGSGLRNKSESQQRTQAAYNINFNGTP